MNFATQTARRLDCSEQVHELQVLPPRHRDPTTEPDPNSFSLLDLPSELWSMIGNHAIDAHPYLKYWPNFNDCQCHDINCVHAVTALYQPAITRTSMALRVELLPYYYQTRICLRLWYYDDLSIEGKLPWLENIGAANRRHLRDAHFIVVPEELSLSNQFFKDNLQAEWELGPPIKDPRPDDDQENAGDPELLYPIIFK